jgi:SnoaL-like domain
LRLPWPIAESPLGEEGLGTWEGPIELEASDLDITVSGDFAFCPCLLQMNGTPKAAGRAISFRMRETMCLHPEREGSKIVHEHASAPFYLDGRLRPAFDLKPEMQAARACRGVRDLAAGNSGTQEPPNV